MIEIEIPAETRQSLCARQSQTSLKYLSTRQQFHRAVSALVSWSPKRDFFYSLVSDFTYAKSHLFDPGVTEFTERWLDDPFPGVLVHFVSWWGLTYGASEYTLHSRSWLSVGHCICSTAMMRPVSWAFSRRAHDCNCLLCRSCGYSSRGDTKRRSPCRTLDGRYIWRVHSGAGAGGVCDPRNLVSCGAQ